MSYPVLRIGVCKGLNEYIGKFAGNRLEVSFRRDPERRRHLFSLEEVITPDDYSYRKVLRERRCHFLLELGRHRGRFEATLFQIFLIPNGAGKPEKVFIGGPGSVSREFVWRGKEPADSLVVMDGMRRLLFGMTPKRFELWLSRMSLYPQGVS